MPIKSALELSGSQQMQRYRAVHCCSSAQECHGADVLQVQKDQLPFALKDVVEIRRVVMCVNVCGCLHKAQGYVDILQQMQKKNVLSSIQCLGTKCQALDQLF